MLKSRPSQQILRRRQLAVPKPNNVLRVLALQGLVPRSLSSVVAIKTKPSVVATKTKPSAVVQKPKPLVVVQSPVAVHRRALHLNVVPMTRGTLVARQDQLRLRVRKIQVNP